MLYLLVIRLLRGTYIIGCRSIGVGRSIFWFGAFALNFSNNSSCVFNGFIGSIGSINALMMRVASGCKGAKTRKRAFTELLKATVLVPTVAISVLACNNCALSAGVLMVVLEGLKLVPYPMINEMIFSKLSAFLAWPVSLLEGIKFCV